MSNFERLPEFEKEFNKLVRKYPSLSEDIDRLEKLIAQYPSGVGTNFTIVHSDTNVKIIKTRLACRSLRERSMRIIYAYHEAKIKFVHIEIYFKGNKENEDRDRIKQYLNLNKNK